MSNLQLTDGATDVDNGPEEVKKLFKTLRFPDSVFDSFLDEGYDCVEDLYDLSDGEIDDLVPKKGWRKKLKKHLAISKASSTIQETTPQPECKTQRVGLSQPTETPTQQTTAIPDDPYSHLVFSKLSETGSQILRKQAERKVEADSSQVEEDDDGRMEVTQELKDILKKFKLTKYENQFQGYDIEDLEALAVSDVDNLATDLGVKTLDKRKLKNMIESVSSIPPLEKKLEAVVNQAPPQQTQGMTQTQMHDQMQLQMQEQIQHQLKMFEMKQQLENQKKQFAEEQMKRLEEEQARLKEGRERARIKQMEEQAKYKEEEERARIMQQYRLQTEEERIKDEAEEQRIKDEADRARIEKQEEEARIKQEEEDIILRMEKRARKERQTMHDLKKKMEQDYMAKDKNRLAELRQKEAEFLTMKQLMEEKQHEEKAKRRARKKKKLEEEKRKKNWGSLLLDKAVGAAKGLKNLLQDGSRYHLLLIGETGSGKTSFLNLLCNINLLLGAKNYEDGANGMALAKFEDITVGETHEKLNEEKECGMGSKTDQPWIKEAELFDLELNIIDTPGFGDTRGFETDKRHVEAIVKKIETIKHVNCVMLVVNGRSSRMTRNLQYVLSEIQAILPKQIRENIIVVFTNSRGSLERNFDVGEIESLIPVKMDYDLENPYCKLGRAQQKVKNTDIAGRDRMIVELKRDFDETIETITNIYLTMHALKPVYTNVFMELYTKRNNIQAKVALLLTRHYEVENQKIKLASLSQEIQSAQSTAQMNKEFKSSDTVEESAYVSTPYHNTLCTVPGCNTNCHEECGLPMSQDPNKFIWCGAMTDDYCRCGHYYDKHLHYNKKWGTVTKTYNNINEEQKNRYESAQSLEVKKKIALDGVENQKRILEDKLDSLGEDVLKCVYEYQDISMLNSYLKYIQIQIEVLEETIKGAGPQQNMMSVKKMKKDLEIQMELVKNPKKHRQ